MITGQSLTPDAIGYNWTGDWSPQKIYEQRDVVRYKGRVYFCKNNDMLKNADSGFLRSPDKDTGSWEMHTYGTVNRGAWAPYRTYVQGDQVMYAGEWYQCIVGGHNINPMYENGELSTKWNRIFPKVRLGNTDKYLPQFANQPPIGWNRNGGHDVAQEGSNSDGTWLITWDGSPVYYSNVAGAATGANYNSYTAVRAIRPTSPGFGWIDSKSSSGAQIPLTGERARCIQILAGRGNTFFLLDNGEVYSTGSNENYQLGVGARTTARGIPQRVGRDDESTAWNAARTGFRTKRIIKLAGGTNYAASTSGAIAALASDGTIWVWGDGSRGQQGDGTINDSGLPTQIPTAVFNGKTILDIYAMPNAGNGGTNTSFYAIDSEGFMWTWGDNTYGQIGRANNLYFKKPQRVGYDLNQYGGIKKFQVMGNQGAICTILCNDGSLHFAGRMDYMRFMGSSEGGDNRTSGSFQAAEQFLYRQMRATSSTSPAPWAWDLYKNIEDMWGHSGYVPQLYMKEKDSNFIYFMGYGSSAVPNTLASMSPASNPQNASLTYSPNGVFFQPAQIMNGAINDITNMIGYASDNAGTLNSRAGVIMINQDNRCKVISSARGEPAFGISDPLPANADTSRQFNMFYLDEKNGGDDDLAITPRGGPQSLQVIHAQGWSHLNDVTVAGFTTISADGTAGFYGSPSLVVTPTDWYSATLGVVTADAPIQGRLRII